MRIFLGINSKTSFGPWCDFGKGTDALREDGIRVAARVCMDKSRGGCCGGPETLLRSHSLTGLQAGMLEIPG